MAFAEDTSLFFSTGGFADDISILGVSIRGIFNNEYISAEMIGTSNPHVICSQADLDELYDFHDNDIDIDITVNGIEYVMVGMPQYDGTGIARLDVKRRYATY